jgi:diguanylate cyclase (GGDEF)-like protein
MLDLDDFKRYNDSFGHLAGDELLRVVAVTLMQSIRSGDTLARYGGEEFVVILPETELDEAEQAAERLRQVVEHLPLRPGGTEAGAVTISLGISAAPQHALTPNGLVNAADVALYQAKARGKNRSMVFHEAMVAANAAGLARP